MTRRYENPFWAMLTGLRDQLRRPPARELAAEDRLDGKTAIVTGANRGLGRAIAAGLAARGARVLLACRGDASETLAEIGRGTVVPLDLADLASCDRALDRLATGEERLETVVLNAGVVPRGGRRTAQGLELQLGVNYLANFHLVEGMRARDLLSREGERRARIIAVSSESHRSAEAFDLAHLDAFEPYGIGGVMPRYGESKLLLTAWAQTLARRLEGVASVHTICPGPIASGIAGEAPALARPLIDFTMRRFFASPEEAAEPVLFLALAGELEGQTGLYFHRWQEKASSPLALDRKFGEALWAESERVLREKGVAPS